MIRVRRRRGHRIVVLYGRRRARGSRGQACMQLWGRIARSRRLRRDMIGRVRLLRPVDGWLHSWRRTSCAGNGCWRESWRCACSGKAESRWHASWRGESWHGWRKACRWKTGRHCRWKPGRHCRREAEGRGPWKRNREWWWSHAWKSRREACVSRRGSGGRKLFLLRLKSGELLLEGVRVHLF
ncbi:hypothetical protein BC830DRAFT_1133079 [Chytriomyces sp. MP71]|nr:hypothetical protein BC830DRAFT_1133079 [Chytriomyces sp. MP71]